MIEERLGEALARVQELRDAAIRAIDAAGTTAELDAARVRYTGRNSELRQVMRVTPSLPTDADKKTLGAAFNAATQEIEAALQAGGETLRRRELEDRLEAERVDVTLPGTVYPRGYAHPVVQVRGELIGIFRQMGYDVYEGPDVEWEELNFDLLNIPRHHPARDTQDTFWVTENILLRTQTSPAQVRYMRMHEPPIRVVVPGSVYRNEAVDASHEDEFTQIEGLAVGVNITMADLKGTLTEVARRFFGPDRRVRFRPGYFPFTEPSAELDVECGICHGRGCRSCGNEGWLEVLGSGMVHPSVLRAGGYDPERVSGFAFGMGPDRFAMLKYGITDIRLFREDDLRFLRQFS